jgi:hypothetical protein
MGMNTFPIRLRPDQTPKTFVLGTNSILFLCSDPGIASGSLAELASNLRHRALSRRDAAAAGTP